MDHRNRENRFVASAVESSTPSSARLGIGGPVGSGKTALIERLLPLLAARDFSVAVVTNDLVTKEDAKRLQKGGLIAPERVVGVEAGACPHTVIREDPTLNIEAANILEAKFAPLDIIVIESGGDNLASTFSLDLVDYWIFVIDVAGGDDIPRKKGPGIVQADLLIINKTDLGPHVGVDVETMRNDAEAVRGGKPVILTDCRVGKGLNEVVSRLAHDLLMAE
ncbi:MAG: urease accessory protein UreG [Rhodospirillaceae bacterium]|nr:urease accessory protein UreG [Rhodospirillaceae bacterium]